MRLSYKDELSHYGVLGMKWGRKRGPSKYDQLSKRDKKIVDTVTKSQRKRGMLITGITTAMSAVTVGPGEAVTSLLAGAMVTTVSTVYKRQSLINDQRLRDTYAVGWNIMEDD